MWRAAWLRAWLLGPALLTHRVERSAQRPLALRPASPEAERDRQRRETSQKAQTAVPSRSRVGKLKDTVYTVCTVVKIFIIDLC